MVLDINVAGQDIRLTNRNYLSQGGEGVVYKKDKTAYKIYHNNKISEKKIKELSVLSDSRILKPKSIVYKDNEVVGYSMNYEANTYPLCQVFTKSFQSRYGLSNGTLLNLLTQMIEVVNHIHSKGILIVDLNEYNILVDKNFKKVYFIDVDSYQTKSYPATAIMEHIKDPHAQFFSIQSDYYSLAILAFNLLIGIHPFKGKSLKKMSIKERMLNNISVLNKNVKIPSICSDINSLPKGLFGWFVQMFEEGVRLEPPKEFGQILSIKDIPTPQGELLISKKEKDVFDYMEVNHYKIVKNDKGLVVNSQSYPYFYYGLSDKGNIFFFKDGSIFIGQEQISLSLSYERVFQTDEAIYLITEDSVYYVEVLELQKKSVASVVKVANVMANCKEFQGALVYDFWGEHWLVKLEGKKSYSYKMSVKNDVILDLKIIDDLVLYSLAKAKKRVEAKIEGDRVVVKEEVVADFLEISFAKVGSVVVKIDADGELVAENGFHRKKINHNFNRLILKSYANSVYVIDQDLFKISLK